MVIDIVDTPVTSITVDGQGGVSTITTDGGTLQMVETILPIDASNKTVTWSVVNGTGSAIIDASGVLSATGNGTITVTATANDGTGITGNKDITISNQAITTTWIGGTSDVWTDATNWDNGVVPLDGYNIIISGVVRPIMPTTGSLSLNNITVNAGNTLKVQKFITDITGTLTNNGGVKIFKSIVIGKIYNNNWIELKTASKVTINGISGVSIFNGVDGEISILSEETKTGSLITKGTLDGTGNYIVYRWISSAVGVEKWHLVSSPVSSALSGVFKGHYLNEYLDDAGSFKHIIPTDIPLVVADGYITKYEGTLAGSATDVISFEGTPNTESFNNMPIVITVNERGNLDGGGNTINRDVSNSYFDLPVGFNLVGNPYTSGLNWDKVYHKGNNNVANVTPYMYYFLDGNTAILDPDHTPPVKEGWKAYKAIDPSIGGYVVADEAIISLGQGFGVVLLDNIIGGTLSINKAAKIHSAGKGFGKKAIVNSSSFELSAISGGYIDDAEYIVDNNATTAYDAQYDAFKINSFSNSPNLSFIGSDNNKFTVSTSPEESIADIGFNMGTDGEVVFSINNKNGFEQIILEDKQENKFTDLTKGNYTFQYSIDDDETGRFVLHFAEILNEDDNLGVLDNLTIYSAGSSLYISTPKQLSSVKVKLYNLQGQVIINKYLDVVNGVVEITTGITRGIYVVELYSDNNEVIAKKISF